MSGMVREAKRLADGGSYELAGVYAAIAQAEALERIADRLDSVVWDSGDGTAQVMVVPQR